MKLVSWLLGGSLAANVVFGAWWFTRTTAASHSDSEESSSGQPPAASAVESRPEGELPVTPATWTALTAGTPAEQAARLKREGFSPVQIKALVTARVRTAFAARLNALQAADSGAYWRRNFRSPDGDLSAEARAERRQINREINLAVRTAMGADFDSLSQLEQASRQRSYGPLPSPKVDLIRNIDSDYSELSAQVRDRAQGVILPEDREQLRLLERERRADLAAVLTPDELLEYDLRSSPSAYAVRSRLAYFEVNEEEYRSLVKLRLTFDAAQGGTLLSEQAAEQKRAAESDYLAQVRAVLSPEPFADYELLSSDDYRRTITTLARFNLEQSVVREVVVLRRDIAARAAEVAANPVFGETERAAQLTALQREAAAKLSATLGIKAYEVYVHEGAGRWIRALQPATTTKP